MLGVGRLQNRPSANAGICLFVECRSWPAIHAFPRFLWSYSRKLWTAWWWAAMS
jgi:hypothetical protein